MMKLFTFNSKSNYFYLIIFVISLTGLGFEVVIIRYFSIIFSHHYIFLSVSVALLGYGIGGIIVSRFNLQVKSVRLIIMVYGLSYLLPIFLPVYLPFFLSNPIILSIVFLPPFLFSGIIIGTYYRTQSFLPAVIYLYDLSGAGFGIITSLILLNYFNPINVIILFMMLVGILMIIINRNLFSLLKSVITALVLILNIKYEFIDIPFLKIPSYTPTKVMVQLLQKHQLATIERTYWSVDYRTDVINYENNHLTRGIFIDGGAPTIMFKAHDRFTNLQWLKNTINYLPMMFVFNEDFLSIGPGGGLDILLAHLAEFKKIEAVEINPSIRKVLADYKEYNGHILETPGLFLKLGEGRNYLMKNRKQYDLIFLSLSLTSTSTTAGVPYAESYLHTVEAYIDYYQHLKETGIVALFCETYPFLLRSILTMIIALNKSGIDIKDTYKHVAVISNFLSDSPYKYLVMLNKKQITLLQAQAIQKEAYIKKLNIEFLPYLNEEMPLRFEDKRSFYEYINQIRRNKNIDITPVFDESPFFYDFSVKPPLSYILLCAFTLILALSLSAFIKEKNNYLLVSIFYLLGVGFMIVEIVLIQKFIFFLGSQAMAFSIILFVFLFSCSLGGLCTTRLKKINIFILLPVLLFLSFLFLNNLLLNFVALNNLLKYLIAICWVSILGSFMGMFFPKLLTLVRQKTNFDIGIIYGINGVMSVFGSTFAMIISRELGYKYNLLIASFLYLTVFIILKKIRY